MKVRGILLAGVAGLLFWGEFVNWRASHSMIGDPRGSREVIVVLGFRNSAPKANALNRWRVRAGLRSRARAGEESTMIFSGGAVTGAATEAELMAEYARHRGYLGPVELETLSRSTWENVAPMVV
ncbi:YdcF family protein [Nocardia sp. X0981]